MQIVNVIKDSFQDCLPFNHALTLFSFGCNLSCELCKGYNYEFVTDSNNIIGNAIDIIKENITPLHDSVVFIGGEPLIHGDKLIEVLEYCKSIGLKTKIFTNGVLSDMVKEICDKDLCDAWSVDYKGIPQNISKYIGVDTKTYAMGLTLTLQYISSNKLPLEIRTTYFNKNKDDRNIILYRMKDYEYLLYEQFPDYPYFKFIEQKDARSKYDN